MIQFDDALQLLPASVQQKRLRFESSSSKPTAVMFQHVSTFFNLVFVLQVPFVAGGECNATGWQSPHRDLGGRGLSIALKDRSCPVEARKDRERNHQF